MTELWKQAGALPYEISNFGRVRRSAAAKGAVVGKVRRLFISWNGYHTFRASCGRDGKINVYVHILVAEAFFGPRPAGMVVNHRNGIKTDNRAENLEYITQSENVRHATESGLRKRGSARTQAKLSEEDIPKIRSLCAAGVSQREVASGFGVTQSIISDINRRVRWAHVA